MSLITHYGPEERARVQERGYLDWCRDHNPLFLPSLEHLTEMHDDSAYAFASPRRNGDVQGRDKVAGFEPHAIPEHPKANPWPRYVAASPDRPTDLWMVGRMELVSLLKHATPQVYVSANLPRMDDAASLPLRSPDGFEAAALQRLQAGEDIVVEARTNRIVMVGSIRAEQRCTERHKVQRGEVLGAFTYELLRRKPMAPATAPPKPAG